MDSIPSTPSRVVVLDTETTGLDAAARIVEFAALEVDPRSGRLGRRLHHLVDPQVSIPAAVTRIHGIRDRDVAGKPPFSAIAGEISAFLHGATLAIQNASFDRRILDAELTRADRRPLADLEMSIVDTVAVSRGLFPLLGSHRLDGMCDHLGIDRASRRFHGALVDAQLLAQLLPRLGSAYDAWCSSAEPDASPGLDRFERALAELCEGLDVEMLTNGPECADRAFARIVAAQAGLRRVEWCLIGRLQAAVPGEGWCSKYASARWVRSDSVSWKDAAATYLSDDDLLPYRSESRSRYLTSLPLEDAGFAARCEAVERHAFEAVERASLSRIGQAVAATRTAAARIGKQRNSLRELLLRHADVGYRLRCARLDERTAVHTRYREAVLALAAGADLDPFTSSDSRLSLRSRDLSACAALFGERSRHAQPTPGRRVA